MIDHIKGSEADSGFTIAVKCSCRKEHRVAISKIGRIAYSCGDNEATGVVNNWNELKNKRPKND